MIPRSRISVALAACCLLVTGALGHGASKGLHLHVAPDPARKGEVVQVKVDASSPLRSLRIGFVGQQVRAEDVDPPGRRVRVELRVPESVRGDTLNIQAEASTSAGETVRASAVLRIVDDEGREEE